LCDSLASGTLLKAGRGPVLLWSSATLLYSARGDGVSRASGMVLTCRDGADAGLTSAAEGAAGLDGRGSRGVLDVPLGTITRPSWRGRSHLIALVVAVPLLSRLSINADGGRAGAGLIVYAMGLCSMLLVSTTYHRWVHTMRWRTFWRRADHAVIFAAIAGTYTPLCLVLFPTTAAIVTLAVVWSAALVGVTIKFANWQRAEPVATAMYVTYGWAGVVLIPALVGAGLVLPTVLLVLGGVIYTAGALGFARRWPTLKPTVFSYHEVWHLCTLTAAGAHLAAVWIVAA
jgi:hemolysin III